MKKYLFLVAIMLTSLAAVAASFSVGNYKYITNGTTATVDGFSSSASTSSMSRVEFPSSVTYGGTTYYVKYVGSYAFSSNTNIEEVKVPYGVTEIEESAFEGCTNLDAVYLPSSLTRLQSDCFGGCTAGLYVYCAAKTPPTCVDGPFDGAKLSRLNLRRDVAAVVSSYQSATGWKNFSQFMTTANAYDVVLNEGKTTASYYVISHDGSIRVGSVLYDGVATVVGGGTECYVTDVLTLNGKKYVVSVIGNYSFSKTASVNGSITKLSGCQNVEDINESAFEGSNLTSASFPKLAVVESKGFKNCAKLSSIGLGDELANLFGEAFYGCTSLKSVVFPRSSFGIGARAFYGSGLTSVELYRGTWSFGDQAFANCASLKKVYLHAPYSKLSLGSNVFKNISTSTTELHVPHAYLSNYESVSQLNSAFNIIYGDQDMVTLNGKKLTEEKTAINGITFDREKLILKLDNVKFDTKGSNYPFIRTNCPDLTVQLKGVNIVYCKGFMISEYQHNATHGNVTIVSEEDGGLCTYGKDTYSFDFHDGGNLTVKDVSLFYATNDNCAAFMGRSGASVLTLDNASGSFACKNMQNNVIGGLKKLELVETTLTNCTYSATATAYGKGLGRVDFESTKTAFSGELYIAGTKVTAQNRSKNAIVNGVSVAYDGTVTLDNVSYSSSSATFIKTTVPNINIVLLGNNTVNASVFLRAESGNVTIEGGGDATLTTTGSSSGVANMYFAAGGTSCTISNVKNFVNNCNSQYAFLGKSGTTTLKIENSTGEFKRKSGGNIAIGQIKGLTLVDTKLTNCTYSASATQYGRNGSVQFETTVVTVAKGDVNGDGVVSGADVTALYNVLLDNASAGGDADVNGDGIVNGSDVTALYNILLN